MGEAKTVTVSAYSEDYSEKAYKFFYGNNNFEFVPKSQAKFLESSKTGEEFGEGVESRCFEIPTWLASKLKGASYYTFM